MKATDSYGSVTETADLPAGAPLPENRPSHAMFAGAVSGQPSTKGKQRATMGDEHAFIPGLEVLAKLSAGGMGEILLARRRGALGFEKLLAVKIIKGELARRPDIQAMFLDEARLVALLDHPNIAQVHDFGEAGGTLFLAMEYVPGIPLNQLLARRGRPLPPLVAARIASEVARGLHAAHELTDLDGRSLGVVHRDVSPGNLILTYEGRIKILDFGIAFMSERESPDTQVGELKGKPSYMAPEQLRAERVDRRSDIYSLSVVLHEMLTGRKLFSKNNVVATALAVERGEVPLPSTFAKVPEALDDIVMMGLERKASDRFTDAREMADALDAVIARGQGVALEAFVEKALAEERREHRTWLSGVLARPVDALEQSTIPINIPAPMAAAAVVQPVQQLETTPGRRLTPPPAGMADPVPSARLDSASFETVALDPPMFREGELVRVVAAPQVLEEEPQEPTRFPLSKRPMWIGLALFLLIPSVILGGARLRSPRDSGIETEPVPAASPAVVELESPRPEPAEFVGPAPLEPAAAEPEEVAIAPVPDPVELDAKEEEDDKRSPRAARRKRRARRSDAKPAEPKETKLATPSGQGFLTVGATPYALVRVDGKEVGVTPIYRLRLDVGAHLLQLIRPDTGEVRTERQVLIRKDALARVTFP